jgi:hypothetical protein
MGGGTNPSLLAPDHTSTKTHADVIFYFHPFACNNNNCGLYLRFVQQSLCEYISYSNRNLVAPPILPPSITPSIQAGISPTLHTISL